MSSTKYIRFPWATSGDKTTIPDTVQLDGSVSYPEGYGVDYELELGVDASAKPVPRDSENQFKFDMSSNVQAWQQAGLPEWVTAAQNGGVAVSYPINAMVRHDQSGGFLNYISLIATNTAEPGTDADKWAVVNSAGTLLNVRVFNVAGTSSYTPTVGTKTCVADVTGGGGGGAGAGSSGGAGLVAIGGSGGGAARSVGKFAVSALTGQTITVGAGGAATISAAVNGNNGAASSIGAVIIAGGGSGGFQGLSISASSIYIAPAGLGGQTRAGGNIFSTTGAHGSIGYSPSAAADPLLSGSGGNGPHGGGGAYGVSGNSPGQAGTGPGAGGSGGVTQSSAISQPGGAGATGLVIIYEYS